MTIDISFENLPKPNKDSWIVCWVEIGDMSKNAAQARIDSIRQTITSMMIDTYGSERQKILFAPMQYGKKTMEFETVGADEYVIWRLSKDE